jgi:agmatinase
MTSEFSFKIQKTSQAPFLEAQPLQPDSVVILGIPYDRGACFRKGARFGPNAIREFSQNLESFSPLCQRDLLDLAFADLGNLELSDKKGNELNLLIENAVSEILQKKHLPLFLGGDHSISFPIVSAFLKVLPDLALIHFDAHADLRTEFEGEKFSNACVMGNILEKMGNPAKRLYQFGIRSFSSEEYEKAKKLNTVQNFDINTLSQLAGVIGRAPVYLSFDLDIFDPAFLPGTGTPEAGGTSFKEIQPFFEHLKKFNIVGADLVELAPNLDLAGISAALAAKMAREFLLNLF